MCTSNITKCKLMVVFAILICVLRLNAQETKESVILYNTVPVRAEITNDAEVRKIIREEPDYLKGYTLKIQDYGQFVDQNKIKAKSPAKDVKAASSAPVKTEESDFIEISFDPGYATLSDKSVDRLDTIVKKMKKEPSIKITLRALSQNPEGSVNLNRLNSIKTYLKLRGVDVERVLTERLQGDRDADEVKIFYSK